MIAAAGDIACDPGNSNFNGGLGSSNNCRQKYTSDLLVNAGYSGVLLLGDNQYYCGGYQAYVQSYDLSWGRVKNITYPSVGNHEYLTNGGSSGSGGTDCNSSNAGAAGHFRYFGAAAGDPTKGYYSFDIGSWHMIMLNSNCGEVGGCGSTSPQGIWLRDDLATHTNFCTLAFWHAPLFSSGGRDVPGLKTFWDALYAANADLVLNGHDHTYERFAPQTPAGAADSVRGIREFVVGSGGANHTSFVTVFPNSEVRNSDTFGILKLTLHATSFEWQFVPEAGFTFTDSGTGQCHGDQSDTSPPTAPGNLTANATAPNAIALSWNASTDNVGVVGYQVYRDGGATSVANVSGTTTSYTDTGLQPGTAHSYTVRATDAGGNLSPHSNSANATTPPDTQPPSAPTNLTANATAFRVDLSWTGSTDNVAVAEYQILRNGVQIGTSTGTSYADADVAPETAYTYRVRARDTANNLSQLSNSVDVTTPAIPSVVTFTPVADAYVESGSQATANFGASNQIVVDASPVRRLLLKFTVPNLGGRPVQSAKVRLYSVDTSTIGGVFHRVADSSWSESGVTWNNQPTADTATLASLGSVQNGQTYEFDVRSLVTGPGTYSIEGDSSTGDGAYYSSKEGSVPPELVLTLGPAPDTTRPTAPTNLAATPVSGTRVDLSWTASTDNVGVTGYRIFRNGSPTPIATVGGSTTSYSDTTAVPATSYSYTVTAVDAAGNESNPSNAAPATTPDTVAPSAPQNVRATSVTGSAVDLAWNAATDNVAVTGYRIRRNGTEIAQVGGATLAYADTGVTEGTQYTYVVTARDAAGNVSADSNALQVTTPTVRPAAPTGLSAVAAAGANRVDLSWTRPADATVTGYRIYRGGSPTPLASVNGATTTTYADSTVAPVTSYSYTVTSVDAQGDESDPSAPANVTTSDTVAPSPPANLHSTSVTASEVSLAWDAASDNVAVTGYRLFRDGQAIADLAGRAYTDAGRQAATVYRYTVSALDQAGNVSAPSAPLDVTTLSARPDRPLGLQASAVAGQDAIDLSWQPPANSAGVAGYRVYRDGASTALAELSGVASTSYRDTSVAAATAYSYTVTAVDAAGNESEHSGAAAVTSWDTLAPQAPANLHSTSVTASEVSLAWDAASDNVAVTGYRLYRDGQLLVSLDAGTTSYTDRAVLPATTYSYTVTAIDAAGNESGESAARQVTTSLVRPDRPRALQASALPGENKIALSWQQPANSAGVAGYRVYRDGGTSALVELSGVATTSYLDTTVAPATTYTYTVTAVDAVGNESEHSEPAGATSADTLAPSPPANLHSTSVTASEVSLAWDAASDNVAVTGYRLYRDGQQVATPSGTNYTDSGLEAGRTYSYTVTALDQAGNESPPTPVLEVTTTSSDTVKPTAPGNLVATAASAEARVDLTWASASDDVGVTGYRIYRDGAPIPIGTLDGATTTYADTSVAGGTTYSYTVTAVDAAGNESDPSNSASATTAAADTAAPTDPSGLSATAPGAFRVELRWTASSDNVAVTSYRIWRNGSVLTTAGSDTTYVDTTVSPLTHYEYNVQALDAAGNVSGLSNTAAIDTPAGVPTLACWPFPEPPPFKVKRCRR